jgi:hypothetical protein
MVENLIVGGEVFFRVRVYRVKDQYLRLTVYGLGHRV